MPYEVQLPVFEGPLDLLLHLIKREELEITAISMSQITDQYLVYLALMQEREADDLADFLVMAARLLWIKSLALLPRPPRPMAETEEEDPADVLAHQLREYKLFREAAGWLQGREAGGLRAYVRIAAPPTPPRRMTPGDVTLDDLLQALEHALAETPPLATAEEMVSSITVTIAQQIGRITRATGRTRRISFRELLTEVASRIEIIVTLLALLELVKQQRVSMAQQQMFGEIVIAPLEATPAASDHSQLEADDLQG